MTPAVTHLANLLCLADLKELIAESWRLIAPFGLNKLMRPGRGMIDHSGALSDFISGLSANPSTCVGTITEELSTRPLVACPQLAIDIPRRRCTALWIVHR
jgi:hypothetical protein